jgi:hypothetical protein
MSQEPNTIVEGIDDAMKYKLLKFFSTMSLSPTHIQSIEGVVTTLMDIKIDEHRKQTGERMGDVEKELIELKHDLISRIKDSEQELKGKIKEITSAQDIKDTKQDSFINGLKTLFAWSIPATIGVVLTWFFTKK